METQKPQQFASYLLAGDQQNAIRLLRAIATNQPRFRVYQELLTPAMRYIGDLWERNEITVAEEHVATAVCDFVLAQYHYRPDDQRVLPVHSHNYKAMFSCLEGEQHALGLKMVAGLFDEQGWDTRYMGADLPLEYTVGKAKMWQPDVIGLSVSLLYHLPNLRAYVEKLEGLDYGPTVLVGGRLASKYDLRPYCSNHTVIIEDMTKLENWLKLYKAGEKQNASH
ncbi:B12 binding domain-containing protein [Fictibacillus macauensis ZFHKF-1]|uniref:B12 binding domain-containing protein n=1 Tax=Fictibacillus macauensis ZFHKF-1 TaxID=1196324 RepID=I8UKR1_9BACL|nr:cobalamin-dependent protein [Fictibacillus macauensis]EIT87418.1 B12 binding domain-containing protein [Fictibacillus macauensis ZFHKF-1]